MPDSLTERIEEVSLSKALSERYLAYALSTIMARSLPDVRDGLKPVHRRLIFAMRQLHLNPTAGFKKCARVVGDVIGKFHPHGDVAVYDALVRLAQDFAQRYPLIEGQGNFGNIDGDNAAAMRYTEARLTAVAELLLDGIEEDAIDFRPTYDGEEREPVVLPAAFPNLLANGATGIAVGMACAIPPHNAAEVCQAAMHLIRHPGATTAELLLLMPGPDFPTGGELAEDPAAIAAAYEGGRGGFRLRATWDVERGKHGTWQIVVSEIPYQVPKSRLIEQIAALLQERKLPLLADVRDESTETVRLVLEPRSRTVEPAMLMETLFRASALESRISLNMNVLEGGRTPRVMGLRELLQAWLAHRHEVLKRRAQYRLAAIERRLEILEAFLAVYLDLDMVIRIIREEEEPAPALMRHFSLSAEQAEAILNMRLRSLRRLEETQIREERGKLQKEKAEIGGLLKSEASRWQRITGEIEKVRERFSTGALGTRRTRIGAAPAEIAVSTEALVEREPITVILSEKGWIRAIKGPVAEPGELRFKEGDRLRLLVACETTDRLCLFATNGRAYTLKAAEVPRGRGDGQAIRLLAELGSADDVITLFLPRLDARYLVAETGGRGFLVKAEDLFAEKRTGRQVLNLKAGEEALTAIVVAGDHVAVLGRNRKLLIFPLTELPELQRGSGVLLQRSREGGIAAVKMFQLAEGLSWRQGSRQRTEKDLTPWLGKRGQAGRLPPTGFPKSGGFA
ncbi:MAG: DNA topoisomerase IV subunit A [Acetobacteraceae bacterium]